MTGPRSGFFGGAVIRSVFALTVLAPAAAFAGPPQPAPFVRETTAGACSPGVNTLCLNGGRFAVSVEWRDFSGLTGSGRAIPMTGDTGYFWFFTNTNVELIVKVLDATAINGHFWVFYGALSNVEYTLTVTDTATAAQRTYTNPSGEFGSAGDTLAFASSVASPPAAASGPTEDALELRSSSARSAPAASASAAAGGCAADATALCLADGRFRVEVNWTDFEGKTGRGQAIGLTADTGYFWFFNSANVELVVKVLDARAVNGNFWAFYGALSNVEYEIVVLDTTTGESRRYRNPASQFASAGDTGAFPLPPGTPIPAVTAVGASVGQASAASIGPAGGSLASADGVVTLTIPANAVSSTTAFSIQPITNEAPGGLGTGYRLLPEGQTFSSPVQITFRYDQVLSGVFAHSAGVAYQDAQHVWRALNAATLDSGGRNLTVSTTHLSDWANLLGFTLKPPKAQVPVGDSLGLTLAFCSKIEDDELTALATTCEPLTTGEVRTSAWAVNGAAGGSGTTGTIAQAGDFAATFTAPANKPTPNLVTVSATIGSGSDRYQVASNVSIIDDSWIGTATARFAGATGTSQVTWTLQSTVNNVATYRPSGTGHYTFDGCTVTPPDGTLLPDGYLRVDYNANPPTFDGIDGALWMANFNCPPGDPFDGPVTFFVFDAAGVVGADGKTIAGTGTSRDGVWALEWHFVRHAPGAP